MLCYEIYMATVVNYNCLYSNRFTYSPQSSWVCISSGAWEVDASNGFPCSARVLVTFCFSFSQGTAVRLCFPVSPTYPYSLGLAKLYLFVQLKSTPKPEKKRGLPAWALPKHICPLEDELIDKKQEWRRWVDSRKNCQLFLGDDLESQERCCIAL